MSDCLFCKIIKGDIPCEKVYENDFVFAFRDINPQAPEHILIIPKEHIARIENIQEENIDLMGQLVLAAKKIAEQLDLTSGYRLVFNDGADGGQEVEHIHCHLMGGRKFGWPAG